MKKCESLFDWLERQGLLGGLSVLEACADVPLGQGSWTVTIWTFRGWFPKMQPLFAKNNWKLIWRR